MSSYAKWDFLKTLFYSNHCFVHHIRKWISPSILRIFKMEKLWKLLEKGSKMLLHRYEFSKFSCFGSLTPFLLFSCNRHVERVVIIFLKIAWKCTNFKYNFKNLGNKNVEIGHNLHKNAGVFFQNIARGNGSWGKIKPSKWGKMILKKGKNS